ncbi:MAG: LysM peptidoglycan-binding domain-containing protein [Clostridiales bacterium]|nr:LysM peptidoglycan-binding domain-containing protein [Clostridiales bacterium]
MTQTPNGSICAEEYVVKRGDSFYLIAHKLGVPLRDLLAANRDIHPARLMVGDVLCIPREEDDRPQGGNTGSGNSGGSNANNSGSAANGNAGSSSGASAGNSSNASDNSGATGNPGSTGGSQQGSGTIPNGSADSSGSSSTGNAGSTSGSVPGNSGSATGSDSSENNTSTPATPPSAAPVPGLACPVEEQVTIAQGQTIADIQLQNLLSRNTLQTANPAINLDALQAGQKICVPTENIACQLPPTYTLAAGETLETVAMRFNLPLGSLLRVNPCLAPQDFEEGVTVILPR